jgi:hypothetical protein
MDTRYGGGAEALHPAWDEIRDEEWERVLVNGSECGAVAALLRDKTQELDKEREPGAIAMPDEQRQPVKSWMEEKLARLNAVYDRFGHDGLRDFPVGDVSLLLSSKELAFRDAPKGNLTEEQKEANRRLELEVRDLTSYLNAQFTQANGRLPSALRQWLGHQQTSRPYSPRQRDRGRDHDR